MHRPVARFLRRAPGLLAASAIVLGAVACGRSDSSRLVRAEPAGGVPCDIEFYPHVLFGGEDAYLVEGKWYRPATEGWVVFTEEPLELEMLRHTLEPPRASLFGR